VFTSQFVPARSALLRTCAVFLFVGEGGLVDAAEMICVCVCVCVCTCVGVCVVVCVRVRERERETMLRTETKQRCFVVCVGFVWALSTCH